MGRILWSLAVSLLLISCTSTPTYKDFENNTQALDNNHIRVYFIRESKFVGMAVDYPFVIDASDKHEIPNGSFFYVDLNPGEHTITSKSALLPGKFTLKINGEPGSTYYVEITYRKNNFKAAATGMLVGPLLGWVVQADEAGKNNGPFQLIPLSKEQAVDLMQGLKFRHG